MKKKIFQFLRLFLSLAIFYALLMLWIGFFKVEQKPSNDELYAGLAVSSAFLIIGALLLRSYFRNRAKRLPASDRYHSPFYERFKGLVQSFDGHSFQGFGTKYFLFTDRAPDGSVTATNWLILATFPIVPLYRKRIRAGKEQQKFRLFYSVTSMSLETMHSELLSRKLNRMVYLFHYGVFIPLIMAPVVLYFVNMDSLNRIFPGKQFWLLFLAWLAWGIGMVWISKLFHKRWFLHKTFSSTVKS